MRPDSVWPIFITIALLTAGAIVFWWAASERERGEDAAAAQDVVREPDTPRDPVQDYVAFAATLANIPPAEAAESVAEGLRKLAGALGTLDVVDADVPIDLRIVAEHMFLNPDSPGTTEAVRHNLLSVAEGLARRDGDASELRKVAEAIDARVPLSRQQDRVVEFLVRAADAIQRVSRPAAAGVS